MKNDDLRIIKEKKGKDRTSLTDISIGKQPLIPIPQLNKDLSAALYSRQMQEEEEQEKNTIDSY